MAFVFVVERVADVGSTLFNLTGWFCFGAIVLIVIESRPYPLA